GAAPVGGGVAADSAVGDRRDADVENSAAPVGGVGAVTADGAAVDGQCAAAVGDARSTLTALSLRGVVCDRAPADRRRPEKVDDAAAGSGRLVPRYRAQVDLHGSSVVGDAAAVAAGLVSHDVRARQGECSRLEVVDAST